MLTTAAVLAGLALAVWRPWQQEPAPVSATPALAATAELRRTVQEPRTVAIAVANLGAEPVRVVRAELVGDSFAPTGPFEADVRVPPGLIRDVFLRHGPGRCGGQAAPPPAPARAVLEVVTTDGRRHSVELDLPYPNGTLTRRLAEDCAAQLLARSVRIELATLSPLPDGRLRGLVVLERLAGDRPVELHDVTGTVLFDVVAAPRDASRPVAVLPDREDRLAVPVIIDAARCTGHANRGGEAALHDPPVGHGGCRRAAAHHHRASGRPGEPAQGDARPPLRRLTLRHHTTDAGATAASPSTARNSSQDWTAELHDSRHPRG